MLAQRIAFLVDLARGKRQRDRVGVLLEMDAAHA
jgi:hypothetical protein